MTHLDDAICLVTGAARGIGRATAVALAEAGATVVGVDIDPTEDTVVEARVCDLRDEAQVIALVAEVIERHGRLDVLVNNAGLARHNPVDAIRTDDLDLMWAVNVRAPILLSRESLRHMAANGRGQIVNVVSTAGLQGGPGESAYNATKFALRGFSQALAEEGRLSGVRVHAVFPAGVDTGFWADATAEGPGVDTGAAFLRPDDVARVIVEALASPARLHRPEVVVRAVADADLDGIRRKLDWFHT